MNVQLVIPPHEIILILGLLRECQARSGFDLKYPYAYEDHEAKLRHQKEAFNSRGFNGRSKQELHQEQVDLYDILASGRKPTGQSKKKSKR